MDTNDGWHLSKSVPLGLIIGLITQGAAIVWTVSMMMADIESNRKDITESNQLFKYCYYDCGTTKNGGWYDRVYRVSPDYSCPKKVVF